jgi:hypothetical protein
VTDFSNIFCEGYIWLKIVSFIYLGICVLLSLTFFLFFFEWVDWSLNSGLCTCKAGTLWLESHLQSILLWLFWRWGLENCWPSLASNFNPSVLASQVAGIRGVSHHRPCSLTFLKESFILSLEKSSVNWFDSEISGLV